MQGREEAAPLLPPSPPPLQVLSCAGQRVVPAEGVKREKDPTEPLTQVGAVPNSTNEHCCQQ